MSWIFPVTYLLLLAGFLLGFCQLIKNSCHLGRILVLDYMCACIIGLIATHSIEKSTVDYIEIIMIFSLLGFATVLTFMEVHFSLAKETPDHD